MNHLQVKSYGKITQIWNWWSFSPTQENQNRTSLQPAHDIIINVWNRLELESIIQHGYHVIVTSETGEEGLYITPGLAGVKAGDYGYLDAKTIYEKWKPQTDKAVKGFKICIWSDQAEQYGTGMGLIYDILNAYGGSFQVVSCNKEPGTTELKTYYWSTSRKHLTFNFNI